MRSNVAEFVSQILEAAGQKGRTRYAEKLLLGRPRACAHLSKAHRPREGGDTVSAIKNTHTEDGFNYISNAGGAFLEWLEGNESPGVKSLKENNLN